MITSDELSEMSLKELRERYMGLRAIYYTMVGTLYPGIAYNELIAIKTAYDKRSPTESDLPYSTLPPVEPPRDNGAAPMGLT